jgi:RsiW-degrading membrane proteinase PrsW (M82 family)
MAYLFVWLLIIGLPFYLIWYSVDWIFFSENPNSKWAERWENLVWMAYIITLIFFVILMFLGIIDLLTCNEGGKNV